MDIAYAVEQLSLTFDGDGLEPILKQRAPSTRLEIEVAGVGRCQPMKTVADGVFRVFDKNMHVIIHEAPAQYLDIKLRQPPAHKIDKIAAVIVVLKNQLSGASP